MKDNPNTIQDAMPQKEFRAIADDAPIFIWIADENINVTYVNRTYLDYLGLRTAADFTGRVWERLMHPDDVAHTHEVYLSAVRTRKPFRLDARMRSAAAAEYRWHFFQGTPRFVDGRFVGFMGIGIDIEDRKGFEQSLQESERRFRSFVEATAHVIWRTDAHGEVDTSLEEWCAFTGQSEAEARGFGWMNAIHPDDRAKVIAAWQSASAAKSIYEVQYRLKTHAGQWRDIFARGVPVLNEQGDVLEYIGTCIDITEQNKAETALRRSEEKYRELFGSIDEGFCVLEMIFDPQNHPVDYRFIEVNPAFTRHTGLPDAVGKTIRELVPLQEQHWFDIYGQVATTGKPVRFEQQAAALGRWYDVYAFRLRHGQRVGVLFNDVTVRKRAEQAIRDSEQRLEKLVAARTADLRAIIGELEAFSYSLSHDMRAPLRTIQSFSQIVLHETAGKLGTREKDLLTKVATAAGRLDRLIADVLTYSRVVRSPVDLATVDVDTLLRQIIGERPEFQPPKAEINIQGHLHPPRMETQGAMIRSRTFSSARL